MENCNTNKKETKSSRSRLDEIFKSPALRFPGRRRKRQKVVVNDGDNVSLVSVSDSICSIDSLASVDSTCSTKPESKRKKAFNRIASITSLLSPVRPVKKVGKALQRSLSLRSLGPLPSHHRSNASICETAELSTSQHDHTVHGLSDYVPTTSTDNLKTIASYREPQPTPPKRRISVLWSDTIISKYKGRLSVKQLKRQEAIFELYKNEQDLVEDMLMVKKTYYNSMISLKIMDVTEIDEIFGHINELIPMHQDLVTKMKQQRLSDGTTSRIGEILIAWIPQLKRYVEYCSNQIFAKDLLDRKKTEALVDDFLQRCQSSPFSRKLDLWSFLDVPRSSLVKYPLLLKNIVQLTPDMTEVHMLNEAITNIEEIICEVNIATGVAKCRFIRARLDFLEDKHVIQHSKLIDESEAMLCEGILRNSRGTKIHGFLFEKILVLTRQATRGAELRYQVYRDPLAISGKKGILEVEDLKDGAKMGSFKSTFSNNGTGKNLFKVTYGDVHHTLQANDQHDKRMWLNSLRTVIAAEEKITRAGGHLDTDACTSSAAVSEPSLSRTPSTVSDDSAVMSADESSLQVDQLPYSDDMVALHDTTLPPPLGGGDTGAIPDCTLPPSPPLPSSGGGDAGVLHDCTPPPPPPPSGWADEGRLELPDCTLPPPSGWGGTGVDHAAIIEHDIEFIDGVNSEDIDGVKNADMDRVKDGGGDSKDSTNMDTRDNPNMETKDNTDTDNANTDKDNKDEVVDDDDEDHGVCDL